MWDWDTMLRSTWRLPILVLECSKGSHLEGSHAKQKRKLAFSGGKRGLTWLKFSWNNLDPKADIFQWDSLPRPSSTMSKHSKPCVWVERLLYSMKQQKESDRVTLWQVNKTLGISMWTAKIWTAFSCYCWVWSGLRTSGRSESGSPDHGVVAANGVTVAGTRKCSSVCVWGGEGVRVWCVCGVKWLHGPYKQQICPDCNQPGRDWDLLTVVNEFCLLVKVLPCHSLFAASWNIATSQPRHRVFACLLMVLKGLGSESHWKMFAFGSGLFHETFGQFNPLLAPEKVNFLFCLACPPSSCLPFEHSSTKMGILDIDPVY